SQPTRTIAAGNDEISIVPVGAVLVNQGEHDAVLPIAQSVGGPPKMALVLVASAPLMDPGNVGPVEEDPLSDPLAGGANRQAVAATIQFKVYGNDLPPWILGPKRSAYVINYDTIRRNPSFNSDSLSLQISLESTAESVKLSLISMPDFVRVGGETAAIFQGPLDAIGELLKDADALAYYTALAQEIGGDLTNAKLGYGRLADSKNAELARFARRGLRMMAYHNRPYKLSGNLVEHLRMGYFTQFCGFYGPAFAEFEDARIINSTHADSQYRAGESLERIGGDTLDVVQYMGRAGENAAYPNPTIWNAVVAIIKSRGGKTLSKDELITVKDQFILLDRILWAVSHGAFRLGISFYEIEKEETDTLTRHLDRVTGPPDSFVQKRGWYDIVFCVRPRIEGEDRNLAEVGWTDVGPNGAAIASFYHDAPFTSHMKSMYALLYASAKSTGSARGWPDPNAATLCGFQPARFASSALRSALRYCVFPGDFDRLGAMDVPVEATYLKLWSVEGPVTAASQNESPELDSNWSANGPQKSTALVSNDDFIDLAGRFPNAGAARVRATSWIFCPTSQTVWIRMGRNDRASLWLNGRRVIAAPSIAGAKFEGQNLVDTVSTRETLQSGWNEVQVIAASRPTEKNKGWGFSVRILSADKVPVPGLACVHEKPKERLASRYEAPKAGPYYQWSKVQRDPRRLLPCLTDVDLQKISGISDLRLQATYSSNSSFVALVSAASKPSARYRAPADWSGNDARDVRLNNMMDWSREAFAAIRFGSANDARDLLLVRPDAMEAATYILKESESASTIFKGKSAADRLLGWIDAGPLGMVFVLDVRLADGDAWPLEEEDILSPFGKFVPNGPDEFREGPPWSESPPA
ncbi:MAG: hypothetical protein IPK83_10460, partial [Planctomycetes bacterium]|nr:hypothetical protein [Planctomycetota bacterium]